MNDLERLTEKYPALSGMKEEVAGAFQILKESYENGGKMLACGNGGSASDSEHIVGELMKGFYKKRPLKEEEKEKFGSLIEIISDEDAASLMPEADDKELDLVIDAAIDRVLSRMPA